MACSFMCSNIGCFNEVLLADITSKALESRNKQGLSQSLSYRLLQSYKRRTLGLQTLGEDEAAAKRVDEVYQDLLSFSIQYSSSQINNL